MGGRMHGARFNHSRMCTGYPHLPRRVADILFSVARAKTETHEEFQNRTKRAREEADAAQERRAREDKARKERRAREAVEGTYLPLQKNTASR